MSEIRELSTTEIDHVSGACLGSLLNIINGLLGGFNPVKGGNTPSPGMGGNTNPITPDDSQPSAQPSTSLPGLPGVPGLFNLPGISGLPGLSGLGGLLGGLGNLGHLFGGK